MNRIFLSTALLLLFLISFSRAYAQQTVNFAIIGDSASDEYQADDNRGGSYHTKTFVWNEVMVRLRGYNFGVWGCRSEPRRCGYEYNWGRSAATTTSAISSGQHTGLATQISQGKVQHVVVMLGANDFFPVSQSIMAGTMSSAQLTAFINNMVSNVNTILNTIENAGNTNILLVGMNSDISFFSNEISDPTMRGRMIAAIQQYNAGLVQLATQHSIRYWDSSEFFAFMYSNLVNNTYHPVAGININMRARGDEPSHFLLSDNPYVHMGTIGAGIFSNYFIREFNAGYNLGLLPISESEIVQLAGFSPQGSPLPSPSPSSSPLPGDINNDGIVNIFDVISLISAYGRPGAADLNQNGKVDALDFAQLIKLIQ